MTRPSIPEIDEQALRRHGDRERVERVWRRLDLGLAPPRARSVRHVWVPVALCSVFALGVWVGARFVPSRAPLAATAEPPAPAALPAAAPRAEPLASVAAPAASIAALHPRALSRAARSSKAREAELDAAFTAPAPHAALESAPAGPAEWRRLAEAGDFAAARRALTRDGGFERAASAASADELMSLVDIARSAGEKDRAAFALRRVLSAHRRSPEAPLAAWTLGNLLEQSADTVGAAEAYALYRRLSPTGDFAEDAAARQVDGALSRGSLELAARALDEYAENFPRGRRLAEFRKRLAEAEGQSEPASASPNEGDDDDDAAPAAAPSEQPPAALREH